MEPKDEAVKQAVDTPETNQEQSIPIQESAHQTVTLPPVEPVPPKKTKKWIVPVLAAALIIVLGIVGYFAYKYFNPVKQAIGPYPLVPTPTPTVDTTTECGEFPEMLESCTKYTCEFTHPLTGDKLSREINGVVSGKCNYSEGMPNNGKMNCNYTEEMRNAVAKYYRDVVSAESFGTSISSDFTDNGTIATYTINGKTVENPNQEAIDTGQCVVSGY